MAWYGSVRYGRVWYGKSYGLACKVGHGVLGYSYSMAWYGMVCHGMIRHGMVRHGMVWFCRYFIVPDSLV